MLRTSKTVSHKITMERIKSAWVSLSCLYKRAVEPHQLYASRISRLAARAKPTRVPTLIVTI